MKQRVIQYIKTKFGSKWVAERIDYKAQAYTTDMICDLDHQELKDIVREEIAEDVLNELGYAEERFEFEAGIEINELINGIFQILKP